MIKTFKTIAGIIILGGMLSLTACDSGEPSAAPGEPSAAQATEVPAGAQPEASPVPAAADPAETDAPAASAPAAEAPAAEAPAAAEPGASGGTAAAAPQELGEQLKELLQLAKQGKVPGVEYAAHSSIIDDVEAAWGEPDIKEAAGKGIYATYSGKHVVFGFNKGSQIFDVRSSAADLQQLTLKQIKAVLGQPDNVTTNGSDAIYTYQAGKQYQLKFIIPEAAGTVDHISVFCEQDSINNMAG